jgi:hypothetical protein
MKFFITCFTYFALTVGSSAIGASIFGICMHFGFDGEEAWRIAFLAGFGVAANMVALSVMIDSN